jgi:hypothetical protein
MKLTKKNKNKNKNKNKQTGGIGSGYTLVGFSNLFGTLRVPIYLSNHEIPDKSCYSQLGMGGDIAKKIILPELYKLEWVHGKINLYDFLNDGYIILCDQNEKNVFDGHSMAKPREPSQITEWLNEGDTWDGSLGRVVGKTRKDKIIEIETKYPGLFIPIFVNDPTRYHYVYDDKYVLDE